MVPLACQLTSYNYNNFFPLKLPWMRLGHITSIPEELVNATINILSSFPYICRLGAMHDLREEFDPSSTMEDDIRAFNKCVRRYPIAFATHFCGEEEEVWT